jgi:hypothetical protein
MGLRVRGKIMAEAEATLHPSDEEARLCRVMVAAAVGGLPVAVHRALLGTLRTLAIHWSIRRAGPACEGERETA